MPNSLGRDVRGPVIRFGTENYAPRLGNRQSDDKRLIADTILAMRAFEVSVNLKEAI